jgi:rare lipoprotein A
MRPYQVNGVWYTPREQPDYDVQGTASWYGAQFHNRRTADGEIFDMDTASAAHKTLPLPCIVEVTNLENGRKLRVRVNDRGPFVDGRIIDLSREGAKQLGFYGKGTARVRVRYVGPADLARPEDGLRYARADPPPRPRPQAQPQPIAKAYAQNDDDLSAGPADHSDAGPQSAATPYAGAPYGAPAPTASADTGQAAPVQTNGYLASPPRTVRIQAGAFSDRGNAERAAARLAGQGETSIDTIQRGENVLYRVTVRCAGDDQAVGRVAAAGFPGAHLLEAF